MEEFDSSLTGQRQQRLAKVKQLRDLGFDPYPAVSDKSHTNKQVVDDFQNLNGKEVSVTGRVINWREHGQLAFADLQDDSGSLQLYFKNEELAKTDTKSQTLGWELLNLVDVGDHIQATGEVTKTESGEISVLVKELRMLAKGIRPIPSQRTGIANKEERFRRRYLDMTVNPEVRERFKRRSRFWAAVRQFLVDNDFIEVNIPVLEHVTGGADAKPFVTHYDALKQDFYLRISHELPLKRLLGAGYEKVFDIGPRFRNEGFSDEHLPEHIAMEWYWAYADYRDGMEFTKQMFRYVLQQVYGTQQFEIRGFNVDLSKEWEEIYFVDVIKDKFGVDVFETDIEEMNAILQKNGVDLGDDVNRSRAVDNLWKLIRKDIAGPAFLLGVPKFLSPLAKTNSENELLTDRFHPVIAGSELANAFSELNDPVDQLDRFVEQQRMRESGDDEAHMLDIDFVEMLEYGMPPAVGFGLSERVFWFFEDVTAKEGVPFPQLKYDLDKTTLEIYGDIADLLPRKEQRFIGNDNIQLVDVTKLNRSTAAAVSPQVQKRFPGVKFGYIILDNVKVEKNNDFIDSLKKGISTEIQIRYENKKAVETDPHIASFRSLYKEFGVDPNSRLNSAEALIKRIVSGKGLYNVNNVVDTYNVTSAELALPMAAYNLDQVHGQIELRTTSEGEQILKIAEPEPISASEGELVYADETGLICLDFNYRDADRTKITSDTKRIVVFVDGTQAISEEQIVTALNLVGARLQHVTGGQVVEYGTSF